MTAITLGWWSPNQLDATYPHTPGAPSTCAYLVLLRVEIARFTRCGFAHRVAMRTRLPGDWLSPAYTHRTPKGFVPSTRLCCSNPHLIRLACAQRFQWTAVSCYAALCSPDVPPVPGFPDRTSDSLVGFTQRLSQRTISIYPKRLINSSKIEANN